MARSKETFGKKEVRIKKEKKRKEKEIKRARKKTEVKKSGFDDMIAYVDEFGMITSTPPDPDKRTTVDAGSIELKVTKNQPGTTAGPFNKGVVDFFNEQKGFGFIRHLETRQSIFFHSSDLLETVRENNIVVFEIRKGPKGPSAKNVKILRD